MDTLNKGYSLPKNQFLEKKNQMENSGFNRTCTTEKDNIISNKEKDSKITKTNNNKSIENKMNYTIQNPESTKPLLENNFYFDKNNKQMIRYPKNFFKKSPEKKNRTKVSLNAPEWFKVVTDEKNEKFDEIIAKNEETLCLFSRYNKWITVTPKSKNRRKPLEKMKIGKMDETSKTMPNWMQIRAKKDMELYEKFRSAEYNSIRHVGYLIIFFIILIFNLYRIKILLCLLIRIQIILRIL